MIPTLATALFVCLALATGARAQSTGAPATPYRETVVVTGTAAPTTVQDLSRTIRVVTREEIARLPARSVDDLLRLVSSVDVRARGRGVQADFAVRGGSFGQVLVLVDGLRYNNLQSGHHNADLPVTLDQIERIEVLLGPGSSIYGADAFGGTINVITRSAATQRTARLAVGQHGLVEGRASAGFGTNVRQQFAVAVDRSSGFTFDRDYRVLTLASRTNVGNRTTLSLGHVDKDFGAAGFYGNSPSKEWTNQTAFGVHHEVFQGPRLSMGIDGQFRAHRDHFRWDVNRPGFAENRHKTYATAAGLSLSWRPSTTTDVQAGVEGGSDRITSSNLGNHTMGRGAGYVEVRHRLNQAASLTGAVRVDGYSTFGSATSPTVGASWWVAPSVRVRSSVGRTFRVPTFTERFYRDPAHQASSALDPEQAWSLDGAVDWLVTADWMATAGVFDRHERDVIDWVKARPADLWQTTNIFRVRATGLELGVKRVAASGVLASLDYTWLSSDPESLSLLSKYTSDYARHSLVASGAVPLPSGFSVGGRVDVRARTGRDTYVLLDLRIGRDVGPVRLFVDGNNLFDVDYQEIRGIAMPGRWISAGIDVLRW